MAFIDKYNFENLKNDAERIVLPELGRQLETFTEPVCTCNDCVTDMAAIVLNAVKPLYRVSLIGGFYTTADEDSYAENVRNAVFNAIERVRKNPSHDIDQPAEA